MAQVITIVANSDLVVENAFIPLNNNWDWSMIAMTFFLLISAAFFSFLIASLIKIAWLIKVSRKEKWSNIYFVFTETNGSPFSFFRYIFIGDGFDLTTREGNYILQHELTHVKERHSLDKLLVNILLVFGWFNPFVWLIRKELNVIHEFIADEKAVSDGDTTALANMLLHASFPHSSSILVNSFFHSPIKRRLIMLTTSQHRSYSYLRRLLILPLIAILCVLFAFKIKQDENQHLIRSNDQAQSPVASSSDDLLENPYPVTIAIQDEQTAKISMDKDRSVETPGIETPLQEYDLDDSTKEVKPPHNNQINNLEDTTKKPKFDKVFTRTEHPASFANGSFEDYLKRSIQYPASAKENKIEGIVKVKFIVGPDGELSDFKAVSAIGYGLEEEAIRVIRNSGSWTPATQRGQKVPFEIIQEVNFILGSTPTREVNDKPVAIKPVYKSGLVILDGEKMSWKKFEEKNIARSQIAFLSAFEKHDKYGEEGRNGVTFITTKQTNTSANELPALNTTLEHKLTQPLYYGAQVRPSFPGGQKALLHFVKSNLKYPPAASEKKIEVRVTVRLIVESDGTIRNFWPLTSWGYGLEEEAIRLITSAGRWEPAKYNGKSVPCPVNVSIEFSLTDLAVAFKM